MALKITLLSKQALEADITSKRLALKALPEEEREDSAELVALQLAEQKLQIGLFNTYGQTLPEAYLKVFNASESGDGIHAKGVLFADKDARLAEAQELTAINIEMPAVENVVNLRTAVYEYLKTLPLLEGAEDY